MKHKTILASAVLAAIATFGAPIAQALPESQITTIKKTVASVPAPELAAKVASLVATAKASDKQEVAVTTVREIALKKPSALPNVVGGIAKVAPDLSVAVVTEAVERSPEQAEAILKAALSSAPEQADKIAAAVAKAAPGSAVQVARSSVNLVPSAQSEILESIVAAVPQRRTEIQNDTVIAETVRVTRVSASSGPTKGSVSSFKGSIKGTLPPNPSAVAGGQVAAGADPDRAAYGRPF